MSNIESDFKMAKAYEGSIVIPTYDLKEENKNPCFENQYGIGYIYPYTTLDDYSTTSGNKTYRSLNLENRYLRVTVLPELGGRVYSVYDKVSQCEVFYKNSVIKFAPLALRGAFFSGGIEINFPVGHALTGTDTINWELREHDDGSASISCGALEHLSRMRWTVTLTLFPDRCALAQDVQIQNPSPIPGRYFYWCTPACKADDQTEFIYPMRRCRSYMWDGEVSWPSARIDLSPIGEQLEAYEGVPVWPSTQLHEPIDLHWEKNILVQVSVFGSNIKEDFFGAWQHSSNHGYVHFADHHDISGMKHWSWGNAEMSLMTQTSLTDDGSTYAETQCGRMENQHDFDFLQPSQAYRWREWWLPLRGLEGLTCASDEVGARIKLSRADQAGRVNLSVAVCPVRSHAKVSVKLALPGKTLLEKEIAVRPEQPWHHTESIDPQELANQPIHLSVVDENGKTILDYTQERDASYEPSSEQVEAETPASAEKYFNLGLSHEKLERREEAMQAYRQAISMDDSHGPSHVQLGLMHLRAADFDAAGDHFRHAIKADQVEANFYLGTLLVYQGKPEEAESPFKAVPGGTHVSAAALCGLGCIALGREKWEDASGFFRQAIEEDADSGVASLLHAIALRRAGHTDEASHELLAVLRGDPLNHVAIREMVLVADGEASQHQYRAKLERLLADDRQFVLDLACFYLHAGLGDEALAVLQEKTQEWDYPMLAYLAGDLCQKLGKRPEAEEWFDRAENGGPDLVFPSRLEEIEVLTRVIQERPKDNKAKYYLGNFLYAHQRFEDAIKLWEEALEGLASFDVIYRNLGMAYWKRRGDLQRATQCFEEALALNSLNHDLYLHLDDLYVAQELPDKREVLLEKMLQLSESRHDVQKRIVVMLVDLGHYDQAIEMLARERFLPLEMDQSFRQAYVRAYVERAESCIDAGRVEEAIADYRKAMEYPENVGVGRPVSASNAKILYQLGCAYELVGRFDEAVATWQVAAREYHLEGSDLYPFVQRSLDKLNRYNTLGYS